MGILKSKVGPKWLSLDALMQRWFDHYKWKEIERLLLEARLVAGVSIAAKLKNDVALESCRNGICVIDQGFIFRALNSARFLKNGMSYSVSDFPWLRFADPDSDRQLGELARAPANFLLMDPITFSHSIENPWPIWVLLKSVEDFERFEGIGLENQEFLGGDHRMEAVKFESRGNNFLVQFAILEAALITLIEKIQDGTAMSYLHTEGRHKDKSLNVSKLATEIDDYRNRFDALKSLDASDIPPRGASLKTIQDLLTAALNQNVSKKYLKPTPQKRN